VEDVIFTFSRCETLTISQQLSRVVAHSIGVIGMEE